MDAVIVDLVSFQLHRNNKVKRIKIKSSPKLSPLKAMEIYGHVGCYRCHTVQTFHSQMALSMSVTGTYVAQLRRNIYIFPFDIHLY
jgi:hypothetical protein